MPGEDPPSGKLHSYRNSRLNTKRSSELAHNDKSVAKDNRNTQRQLFALSNPLKGPPSYGSGIPVLFPGASERPTSGLSQFGVESKTKSYQHVPLARTNQMTIIAVHGDALDKIGFELCERANRSAEVRLGKLLTTYNNMAAKAEARHTREQREVQELLERLAKVKAVRKEAALKGQDMRTALKGDPQVKGELKLRRGNKPNAGRTGPARMSDKESSMWVVVPSTLPSVCGKSVLHSDDDVRRVWHSVDDVELIESEPPAIVINNTGKRCRDLQKHIYYNQCKPGSELLTPRHGPVEGASRYAADTEVGKLSPGDAPSQLSHASGYVIEGDVVTATNGTERDQDQGGSECPEPRAAVPSLTPRSQAIREDVDRMYRASLTSSDGAATPTENESGVFRASDLADQPPDVDSFNTRLPQVIVRRFPDEGDPSDFGVSMRMALDCNQITTPIDRPSRTLTLGTGRRVFPSLRRDLEPKRVNGPGNQYVKKPMKAQRYDSLPLLPKSSSLVHSDMGPSRSSGRYTTTRTSQYAKQSQNSDTPQPKPLKRKPLKMPTLPIRLRYSKSRESQATKSRDQEVLDVLRRQKRSPRARIDNFLSDDSSDD